MMRLDTPLHIAPGHPAFAGHFPGAPVVPGVALLDAAVHAAMQARPIPSSIPPLGGCESASLICQINAVKFLSPVSPGETLLISCASTASGSVRFDISSGSRKVATGTLVLPRAL